MTEHGIQLDHEREQRIGFDEAIYAAGKSVQQLEAIVAHALEARQRRLFTRLDAFKFEALDAGARAALDFDPISRTAASARSMRRSASTSMRMPVSTRLERHGDAGSSASSPSPSACAMARMAALPTPASMKGWRAPASRAASRPGR